MGKKVGEAVVGRSVGALVVGRGVTGALVGIALIEGAAEMVGEAVAWGCVIQKKWIKVLRGGEGRRLGDEDTMMDICKLVPSEAEGAQLRTYP